MKYKHFPAPFFNYFIQPSPPATAKLKSLHGVLRDQLPPTSPPINMTTMIRQNTKRQKTKSFPLLLHHPGKPDHQAINCPTANFGPLSKGSVSNPILITVFDPNVTRSLGSECSTLNHFSMSLARKCVNLKEPYHQDIKE